MKRIKEKISYSRRGSPLSAALVSLALGLGLLLLPLPNAFSIIRALILFGVAIGFLIFWFFNKMAIRNKDSKNERKIVGKK